VDYRPEHSDARFASIVEDMTRRLDATLDMTAKFDEKFIDPLGLGVREGGRRPRNAVERELTVQLNSVGQFLSERAREECPRESWQGLSDAAAFVSNRIGQLGLPQLMHDDFLADERTA
jgi:hypothetical protein